MYAYGINLGLFTLLWYLYVGELDRAIMTAVVKSDTCTVIYCANISTQLSMKACLRVYVAKLF